MKTSRIIIVIVPVAIVAGVIFYFANSVDFTPSTKENQFGIKETMLSDLSFEEKKSKIIDKYYSNNLKPFVEMAIELKKEYQQGEKISFRLAHFGYTNWCLMPTLAIFHEDYDKPIVENSIDHSCPAPSYQYAPILGIFTQDDFPIELTCKYRGTYTIFGSSYKLEPTLIGQYYCNGKEQFEPPREIDVIIPNGASDPNRTRNFEPNEIHLKWGDYVNFTNNDSITHIVFGETNETIRYDGAEFYVTLEPGRSETIQMLTNGEHWIYSQDVYDEKFNWMSGTIFVD